MSWNVWQRAIGKSSLSIIGVWSGIQGMNGKDVNTWSFPLHSLFHLHVQVGTRQMYLIMKDRKLFNASRYSYLFP